MKNKIILGLIIFSLVVMPFSLGTAPNPGHLCSEFETLDCDQRIMSTTNLEGYGSIEGINTNINGYGLLGSSYNIGIKGIGVTGIYGEGSQKGVEGTCTASGCYGLYTSKNIQAGSRMRVFSGTTSNPFWFLVNCDISEDCATLGLDGDENVIIPNNLAVEGKITPYRDITTPSIELNELNGNVIITLG